MRNRRETVGTITIALQALPRRLETVTVSKVREEVGRGVKAAGSTLRGQTPTALFSPHYTTSPARGYKIFAACFLLHMGSKGKEVLTRTRRLAFHR